MIFFKKNKINFFFIFFSKKRISKNARNWPLNWVFQLRNHGFRGRPDGQWPLRDKRSIWPRRSRVSRVFWAWIQESHNLTKDVRETWLGCQRGILTMLPLAPLRGIGHKECGRFLSYEVRWWPDREKVTRRCIASRQFLLGISSLVVEDGGWWMTWPIWSKRHPDQYKAVWGITRCRVFWT